MTEKELEEIKEYFKGVVLGGLTGGFHFDEECAMELSKYSDKLINHLENLKK